MASLQDADPVVREYILKHSLPQISRALLSGSCLLCPNDPIKFLESKLMAFQGHCNLLDIDWQKFVDAEHSATTSLTRIIVNTVEPEDSMLPSHLFEKAYSYYRKHLTNVCFRRWKRFVAKRKWEATEMILKLDIAKTHYEKKLQRITLIKLGNWLALRKRAQAASIEKLRSILNAVRFKRAIAAWQCVVMDSRKAKENFEKLEMSLLDKDSKEHQIGEGYDGISVLPIKLALKVFQYLEFRDWLTCAEVCCGWQSIIQSGSLWSRINFSVERDWITDSKVMQILQNYCPLVIYINLRGCTCLTTPSLTCISRCRNLQELNLSECTNVTDMTIQKIVEGCPNLFYLNLSCTLVTNQTLWELSRPPHSQNLQRICFFKTEPIAQWNFNSCANLQHLSLAYCSGFTDEGLQYLSTGKGCRKLLHLNVSGCTQMTVEGFRYISAGCPMLRDIVIDNMLTLSDKCILVLVANCRSLSTISLLDTPHLSDIAFKAIAEVAKLNTFSTEGNNCITDASWSALCLSSPGLRRLHAVECPRMTDASLKSVANLSHLLYLNISHCNRVGDLGMQYLTEGSSAGRLRELNVSHCKSITDISVIRIAQRLSKLNRLNLSYCESLTDISVEWLKGSSISSLDISGCNIQDQGLSALEGTRLRKVALADCVHITDIGFEMFCKQARDLEHLDVSCCVALSDSAIKALSLHCGGLVTLRMSGCPKMTDASVQYLTAGAHHLRELNVSGCVLLTEHSVGYLERICPPLSSITMTYCHGISKVSALRLKPRVQHWKHSTDDPPYSFGYNNMGQMVRPIRGASKTGDTWEGGGRAASCDNKSRK